MPREMFVAVGDKAMSETTKAEKLERKIIRRAQQIGCEARGGYPLGRVYLDIPSWPDWYEQAWEELILIYARKNADKMDRLMMRKIK